jgi:hypothetical protein
MTTSASAPLVAIVTPVYNGARFLSETMDAVQAQSYPNLVHIVLDNASTDATPGILKAYASARVPVQVHRNPATVSMGDNWNKSLTLIPPDAGYFRILCADDIVTPDFTARMVEVAERHPTTVVVGCQLRHRGEEFTNMGWEAGREVFPGREAVARFFEGRGTIIAHQTLIRRGVLGTRSPFFEDGMAANDTDACLDNLRHGDWGFVHATLATTREHPDTDTARFVKPLRMDLAEHLVLMERHAVYGLGPAEAKRLTDTYRRHYVRRLLRWRIAGSRDRFDRHMAALKTFGAPLPSGAFLDAIVDWPLMRLGLRPAWTGFSG